MPHDLKWLLKLQPSCLHSNEQERGKGDRLVLNALSRMHGRKITTLEVTSHLFKKIASLSEKHLDKNTYQLLMEHTSGDWDGVVLLIFA